MKKLMMLSLACMLIIGISTSVFAVGAPLTNPQTWSTPVTATVGPYAEVKFLGSNPHLDFVGRANEVRYGYGKFSLDCNTDVDLTFSMQGLRNSDGLGIPTWYTWDSTSGASLQDIKNFADTQDQQGRFISASDTWCTTGSWLSTGPIHYAQNTVYYYRYAIKGQLGVNISSQPADDYNGTFFVTVSEAI